LLFRFQAPLNTSRHVNSAGRRCYVRVSVEVLVRELFTDFGFTISIFLAVAITAGFAFILEAPLQLVLSMLVMGPVTAILEYVMRSQQQPP
jgi:hypothetical protein